MVRTKKRSLHGFVEFEIALRFELIKNKYIKTKRKKI
jgi:hypothetical protein